MMRHVISLCVLSISATSATAKAILAHKQRIAEEEARMKKLQDEEEQRIREEEEKQEAERKRIEEEKERNRAERERLREEQAAQRDFERETARLTKE
ncbi:hypothetical protein EON64_16495, partial [archaeon]